MASRPVNDPFRRQPQSVNSQRRADLVKCRGGLVRPKPRFNFDQGALLFMDFELGHNFDSSHSIKLDNLATVENQMP
jgi:hypothetical protein